jgi:DNA topoisomerase-1
MEHGNGSIPLPEIEDAAIAELGLRRITTDELTIARISDGESVRFVDTRRAQPVNGAHLKRIKALTIPPAWKDVRIARDRQAHLQAVGRDDAGRLQYIYHSAWDDVRAVSKAYRLIEFGKALPRVRSAVARDIDSQSASFPLAAAVRLIDLAWLRAGHEAYAGEESGRGVATLLKRHVKIEGSVIRLSFMGKGGKRIDKRVEDEALANALAKLRDWKGARLFKKRPDGRAMTATELNAYLVQCSRYCISAKDFRTFFASSRALERLQGCEVPKSAAGRRRIIAAIAREISNELANTPAIARKSYIHPVVIEAFEANLLVYPVRCRPRRGLTAAETALVRFLERHTLQSEGK